MHAKFPSALPSGSALLQPLSSLLPALANWEPDISFQPLQPLRMDSTRGFRSPRHSSGDSERSSDEAEPLLARDVVPESDGHDDADDALDLYTPLRMGAVPPEERDCLKIRALVVGIMLGSLVSASNLYLGKPSFVLFV